jgi:dinuclear metal center YbgI/SA1388 family protein
MATVADLLAALERICPFHLAEDWDNVGLIAGSDDWPLAGPILLTVDLTPDVAREAIAARAGAVIAYHPPIFSAIKSLTAGPLLDLIAARIAVVSPHTALDAAPAGLADFLADIAATQSHRTGGGTHRCALTPHASHRSANAHKIVTFVPVGATDAVRDAMGTAGAGRIGAYDTCAFTTAGTGTFRGSPASNPAVGARGRLERVEEIRLEMVCPGASLAGVITALRAAHPYEEPPIDIHPLTPPPDARIGAGRAVTLEHPIPLADLAARITRGLGVHHVHTAPAATLEPITRIGVCPGAGGSLIAGAEAAGCNAFLTGEMRHHDILDALARGISIILAGHTETERPYLPVLARRIHDQSAAFTPIVSKADRSPFA